MSGKKEKLKKIYIQFYGTGVIRKVMAKDEEDARRIAEEMFGPSEGKYIVGRLRHVGEKPAYPGEGLPHYEGLENLLQKKSEAE